MKIPISVDEQTLQEICDVGKLINEITGKEDTTIEDAIRMSTGIAKTTLLGILGEKLFGKGSGQGKKKSLRT